MWLHSLQVKERNLAGATWFAKPVGTLRPGVTQPRIINSGILPGGSS